MTSHHDVMGRGRGRLANITGTDKQSFLLKIKVFEIKPGELEPWLIVNLEYV